MNIHKIQKFAEPGLQLCLVLMAAFAVATWFFNPTLAYVEAGLIAALIVYSIIRERARRRELQALVEQVTYNAESATNNTLIHFPLPMAVFRLGDSGIVNSPPYCANPIYIGLTFFTCGETTIGKSEV